MGNIITRFSRRTFRIRMKKSKKNRRRKINESNNCQCITIPNTGISQTCMKCVSKLMQEISTNRLNGNLSNNRIIENPTHQVCGSQFDAKKFDKLLKLNTKPCPQFGESESGDSNFDDESSDSFQSGNQEISEKRPLPMEDDDNHSEKSYSSIFELFEKLERDAILNEEALDELFFYPAIGKISDCDENNEKSSNFSSMNDKKGVSKTNQTDDTLLDDETHLYDTVASSESSKVIISKVSKLNPSSLQFTSFKPGKSKPKEVLTHSEETQHTPIPYNATQFYTKQIDDIEFDGIVFNGSQFNAKYFDATPFNVTPFLETHHIENPQKLAPRLDSELSTLNKIRTFKNSQFKASQIDTKVSLKVVKPNVTKFNDALYDTTENQCDDAKLSSALFLNSGEPNIAAYEASINRAAEFVASHFGTEHLNGTKSGRKDFIAASFRTSPFSGSQFDAKQFDVSKFPATRCDVSDFYPTQFTASQFDAKAFEAKKCNRVRKNHRAQRVPDRFFNITQFDAKLFNAVQRDLRRVYAT